MARVLAACEYSGVVRQAFRDMGHDAWSCDLLPNDLGRYYHLQMDVLTVLKMSEQKAKKSGKEFWWDLIIAHPPCTYLTVAGNRHYSKRPDLYEPAAKFATSFFDYAPKVAVENPIGRLSTLFRKPDQIIHPYEFGHPVKKATCLWLKGLDPLVPTHIVNPEDDVVFPSGKRMNKWYYETSLLPHKERAHVRSKTFQGIADAMATQWGAVL